MRQKARCGLLHLLKRLWQVHAQALLTKRAVKSLDVGVQIGAMRGNDIGFDPNAQQEAH
jgi:hypothetical protein